jgi:hypothetical protein
MPKERKKERSKRLVNLFVFYVNLFLKIVYFKLETPPETINFITSELFTPGRDFIFSRGTRKTFPDTL